MKAKSDLLAESRHKKSVAPKSKGRRPTARMPQAERRVQILTKAYEFFSEYGLTAQTRALADACGVSQRLLYSLFPNKAALLNAVYETEIAGPIKAIWFVQLRDRSKPIEERLMAFYKEYYDCILTRRWLRLFLYASLSEEGMAPTYIAGIVTHLLEMIVEEAAREAKLRPPEDPAYMQEIGWILHGAVSHLAIRRHIYRDANPLDAETVVGMHVRSFLGGLKAVLPPA
ncbi:TetR/AcrR family transcriptional regulator [Herbaspirillum sp. ST 5-3]|uniref:TetR/AcrR family transcriptional regulator n=1 Tax=Oxalobacteraceae TaxID=75682 RepID=UPI0010A4BFE0|nr:TetR/AcrR family transcriptional regulator [Herbaspirillum sp. ST 5-3]